MATDRPSYVTQQRVEAPKYRMGLERLRRLSDVTDRYCFFTPALLYLYGRFNDQPLVDFLADYKKPVHLMHALFDHPIFGGLETPDGNADWNRALWAIAREALPAFEAYILSVTMHDTPHHLVFRIGAQDLWLPDPLAVDRRGILERPLCITVFGVDSNARVIAFDPSGKGLPVLRSWPPQPRTVQFAKLMFAGNNPTSAIDPPMLLPTKGADPLRVLDISTLPAVKQDEYRKAIADSLKKEQRS